MVADNRFCLCRSKINRFHHLNSFHVQIEFMNDKREACACIEPGAGMASWIEANC